ncbi:MAG: ParB N-terminal domain-containing protein [Betaproteobacteria bacterium]|nr:ParB N-terminal domain-containing protein [Betaproteobacteria bacterium]
MTPAHRICEVRMIQIAQIDVLNPRDRNKRVFEEIVGNIKTIGLKKPITVSPRAGPDGSERYLLVCGEGRLNAFRALGETAIPSQVVDVSDEDAFIMGLAENIARRQYRPLEMLSVIKQMSDKGHSPKDIAKKTGMVPAYVSDLLVLLERGEERLLLAVERGRLPISAALAIMGAGDDDKAVQSALQEAYETGKLRGKHLMAVRRIIEKRKTLGRSTGRIKLKKAVDVSTSSLVRTYQREVERQRSTIKKAEFTQQRLLFVISALRQLFADENFVNLLRAEGLDSLPEYLADRVWPTGSIS